MVEMQQKYGTPACRLGMSVKAAYLGSSAAACLCLALVGVLMMEQAFDSNEGRKQVKACMGRQLHALH